MTINQIDKRVELLCELADRNYNDPARREEIQLEVDQLMDLRETLKSKEKM